MADEKKVAEAKAEAPVKADDFALEIDGKLQYPKMVGQKIENNKVVAGTVVNSPDEHKKWLKENGGGKPAWGQ